MSHVSIREILYKTIAFQVIAMPLSGGATMGEGAIPHHLTAAAARPAMRRGATGSRGSGARDPLRFWVSKGI